MFVPLFSSLKSEIQVSLSALTETSFWTHVRERGCASSPKGQPGFKSWPFSYVWLAVNTKKSEKEKNNPEEKFMLEMSSFFFLHQFIFSFISQLHAVETWADIGHSILTVTD